MDINQIKNLTEAYQNVYQIDELSLGQVGKAVETTADTYVKPAIEKIGSETGRRKAGPLGRLPGIGDVAAETGRRTAGSLYDKAKGEIKSGNIGGAIKTGRTALDMLKNSYSFEEQSIGVPLKDASDRAAKKQLEKMIPKGEKVHTPKSALQNAGFEPEGDEISEAEVLATKGGVAGSVKVRPALSIPGTSIGVGPNKPVPGTFTTTTPEQRARIKQGDTTIDRGTYTQPRAGAGPTASERARYNAELARQGKHTAPRMREDVDVYDEVLDLLIHEGFSEKDAVDIMATMTESVLSEMSPTMRNLMSRPSRRLDGKKSPAPVVAEPPNMSPTMRKLTSRPSRIIEMSDFAAGGGNKKMEQTGMSRSEVEALGKKNLAKSSNKSSDKTSKSQTTPSDVVIQRLKDTKDRRELEMKAMAAGKSPVGYLRSLAAKEQEKAYNDYMAKKPQKTYKSGRDAWNDLAG